MVLTLRYINQCTVHLKKQNKTKQKKKKNKNKNKTKQKLVLLESKTDEHMMKGGCSTRIRCQGLYL